MAGFTEKIICSKHYCDVQRLQAENERLENIVLSLDEQLADQQAQITLLREALSGLVKAVDVDHATQFQMNLARCDKALAATEPKEGA